MLIEDLNNFVIRAEKSRKYAPNSADAIRVALGYFTKELNEEEKNSIEKIKANFDAIYASVVRANQDKLSPGSLEVYRRRVASLLKDFEEYSGDPAKFVSWNPVRRVVIKKKNHSKKTVSETAEKEITEQENATSFNKEGMTRSEVPLRPGVKAVIWIPDDLNSSDVEKITLYVNYLGSLAKKI